MALDTIEAQLQDPFEPNDIKWRVQQSGISNGKPWMIVLPYITGRAIQKRLDDVFGVSGWEVEHREIFAPRANININLTSQDASKRRDVKMLADTLSKNVDSDGFLTTIRFWDKDKKQWITKQDVSQLTDIESLKGGSSGGLKRAGALLGIGRYLYQLKSEFATCMVCDWPKNAKFNFAWVKDKNSNMKLGVDWQPPELPDWALPGLDAEKFKEAITNATCLLDVKTAYDDAYRWAASFSRLDLIKQFKEVREAAIDSLQEEALKDISIKEKAVVEWLDKKIEDINTINYVGPVQNLGNKAAEELMKKCEGQHFDKQALIKKLKQAVKDRVNTLEGK